MPAEAAVLRAARPCGVILFARNVRDPDQVRRLTDAARERVGDDILVLIDQEGGRVRRLKPPHWRELPPAAAYGALYADDPAEACVAARLAARLTAADLRAVGINTNCAPVLDVPVAGQPRHHRRPGLWRRRRGRCATLGLAVAEGYMAGGVLPVIKHMPGHGRATKDSHLDLPVVTASRAELESTDFAAFRRLAHLPAAMTAHVVFDGHRCGRAGQHLAARDGRDHPRRDRFRRPADERRSRHEGAVGQHRPSGPRPCIAAGSDLALVCSGDLADTEAVAAVVPQLEGARSPGSSAPVPFSGNSSPSTLPRPKLALRWRCAPRPESV